MIVSTQSDHKVAPFHTVERVLCKNCFDVGRERQGVVQDHGKVLCTLGGGHRGVNNCDGAWSWQAFPGRKISSVLLRLSLKWWAEFQSDMSARHAEMRVTTWVSEGVR